MYLRYLTVRDTNGFVIRHVKFKKGINIIKGEDVENVLNDNKNTSTNSLGKTTLLRCIDFCLSGKWNSFIFDKEFKGNKNNTVFDFFKETLPSFELLIVKDIDSQVSASLKIKRTLFVNTKAKKDTSFFSVNNFINDNEVSTTTFDDYVKDFLFDTESSKPSLRQLIPKFIRTSDHQISNIIRYLHPTTSNTEYEMLHLFLFDFKDMRLINQRSAKFYEINQKTQEVKSLKEVVGFGTKEINDVKQSELEDLQRLYESYEISKSYDRESDLLNRTQEEINALKANITNLHMNQGVWKQRLSDINFDKNSVSTETIAYMYQEAEIYNVQLQKKYEETVDFHRNMLENEVEFISKELNDSTDLLLHFESKLELLSEEYSILLKQLGERGSLAEYTRLGNEINALTKEIAENEAIINKYKKSSDDLTKLKTEFESLTKRTQEVMSDFGRKLAVFNRYFLDYSQELANNSYYLAVDKDKNHHFTLSPVPVNKDSHVGDGKKQSAVIAFDLAYTAFANDRSINLIRPHFITQDKVEIVDVNMLSHLIDLVNSLDCQFIFPIIKDKLDGLPSFDDNNVILTLSENNKFFDIENYKENKKNILSSLKYRPISNSDIANIILALDGVSKLINNRNYRASMKLVIPNSKVA